MPRTKLQTPNFNLNKRADGYYVIRYIEDGKDRLKATGTKDAREAEAVRARFVAAYNKPSMAHNPTVAELCEGFLAYRKPRVASPASLDYALSPVKRRMGPLHAADITQADIDEYAETRAEERPERAGGRYADNPVGEATICKELRMLRAALNWAYSEKKIERLPTFRIELSAGQSRTRWITKDEANRLVEKSPQHLALFIMIALMTCKRREAILNLKWENVCIHLEGHEFLDFGDDVGNKKRGRTPIAGATRLIRALHEAKAVAKTPYVIEFRGEAPLFSLKTAFSAACEKAGISPAISAHTLKHSAITWRVLARVPYDEIARFAATSKEMIERVYGHHNPDFVQRAVAAGAF